MCVLLAAAAKANRTNICPFLPRFTSVEKEGGDNDLSSSTDEEGKEKVHQNEFQIIKRSNVLFFCFRRRPVESTTASSYWPMNSTRKAIDLASEQSLGGLLASRQQAGRSKSALVISAFSIAVAIHYHDGGAILATAAAAATVLAWPAIAAFVSSSSSSSSSCTSTLSSEAT